MPGEGEIREAVKNPVPASKSVNRIAHDILDRHDLVADETGAGAGSIGSWPTSCSSAP